MEPTSIPALTPRLVPGLSADRLLTSNLAAISACDLDLAKRVALARPEVGNSPVTVRAAASGWPTVLAGAIHIHSAFDPIGEAEQQAAQVPADAKRVLCLGFGSAPLISCLLTRSALARLDVVALHPGVLRAVAEAVDLKPLLCDPRVRFVPDGPISITGPLALVPPLLKLADARYPEVREAARDALAQDSARLRWQEVTARAAAPIRAAWFAQDPPLSRLANRHRSAVFLVAHPGPSLAAQLPVLQRLLWTAQRQRTRLPLLLVAVDEALPLLLQNGVNPDYVVLLDGQASAAQTRVLREAPVESACLIYTPVAPREVVQGWAGARCVATVAGEEVFAPVRATHPGSDLWSEGHVLHLAVDLARFCGGAAVVLLGAELALPERAGQASLGRYPYRRVAAVAGEPVPAHAEQIACRRALEGYIAQHPALPVYNTSPGGARIAGTVELPLQKALLQLKVTDA